MEVGRAGRRQTRSAVGLNLSRKDRAVPTGGTTAASDCSQNRTPIRLIRMLQKQEAPRANSGHLVPDPLLDSPLAETYHLVHRQF